MAKSKIKYFVSGSKNSTDKIIKVHCKDWNKCQASVKPTNQVEDKKNDSPCALSPFFHLLRQLSLGFQNNPHFLKIEVEK